MPAGIITPTAHNRLVTAAGGVVTLPEVDHDLWYSHNTFHLYIPATPVRTGSPTTWSLLCTFQKRIADTTGNLSTNPKWTNFDAYDYANFVVGGVGWYSSTHVGDTTGLIYNESDSGSIHLSRKLIPGCPVGVRLRLAASVGGGTSPTVSFTVAANIESKD